MTEPPIHRDDDPCEHLAWDSQFFGISIARIRGDTLTPESAGEIDRWCLDQQVKLLCFAARSDDAATVSTAERWGYHLTDVRSTFERDLSLSNGPASTNAPLRPAMPEDLPAMEAIARVSHTDSRFYYDGFLPRAKCDELFATWIRNSYHGFSDAVLTMGEPGKPQGYVTCHLRRETLTGSIGLIAVEAGSRGKGVGSDLLRGAAAWLAAQSMRRIAVVTQARNVAAQRLYERNGFVVRSLQLYYHKWFSPPAPLGPHQVEQTGR